MIYGVTVQTVGHVGGDGITMFFIDTNDPVTAESRAARIGRRRFGCEVLVDHPVPCPGFAPSEENGAAPLYALPPDAASADPSWSASATATTRASSVTPTEGSGSSTSEPT